MSDESRTDTTIATAERICDVAKELDVDTAIIGAVALAVHGYPRDTEDIDIAVHADPFSVLRELCARLLAIGLDATLTLLDADDPLGLEEAISG